MTLRYVRGISYSQLYKEGTDNFDELIHGLPTCESVIWLSFLVHQKITLQVGQTEYNIMGLLLFQLDADLQHRVIDFMGPVGYKTDQFFDIQSLLTTIRRLLEVRNDCGEGACIQATEATGRSEIYRAISVLPSHRQNIGRS